jgi:hypothetical protein
LLSYLRFSTVTKPILKMKKAATTTATAEAAKTEKAFTEGAELPRIVRYKGEEGDDIPFLAGDLIKLIEEDDEGFFAVPKGATEEEEDDAITVFPHEFDELDEEERDEAEEEFEAEADNPSEYEQEKATAARVATDKKLKVTKAAPPKGGKKTAVEAPVKEAKTTTVKAPKVEQVDKKPVVLSKGVKEVLAGTSAVVAARKLVKQAQATDYTLGGVLCKIEQDKDYEKVKDEAGEFFTGKDGFEKFIENDLGIKYRKARYLMNVYETFSTLKVSESRLLKLKYSKAKEILDVVQAKPEDAEEWLEKADTLTLEDLNAQLTKARKKLGIERTARGTGGQGGGSEMTTLKVRFFNDQAKVVEQALDKAKKQVEVGDGDTEATVLQKASYLIYSEWLESQS